MKKIGFATLLLAGGFLATHAYAAVVLSNSVTVTKVDVETDPTGTGAGTVYLQFSANPFGATGTPCSSNTTGTGFWAVGGNQDSVKAIHSSALAAKLAGVPVKILWNNTNTGTIACNLGASSGFPVLRGLSVE